MVWLVVLLMFLASVVTGLSGFGFGIVTMSFLPLLMEFKVANPVVSVTALGVFTALTIPIRSCIDWRALPRTLAGMVLGIPLGVYALVWLPDELLAMALGVFILLYVVFQLYRRWRELHFRLHRNWSYLAGAVSGVLAGALNSGGPPVVVYYSARGWDKTTFKATLQAFFVVLTAFKLPLLAAAGLLTAEVWTLVLYAAPFVALGTFLGVKAFNRVSEGPFSWIVLVLLFAMGVTLIVKQ